MKKFETPAIEVVKIAVEDVIATSSYVPGGDGDNGSTGGVLD